MRFEDRIKMLKLKYEAMARVVVINKKNASDFNLRKSFLAGQHHILQEVLKDLKFVKMTSSKNIRRKV